MDGIYAVVKPIPPRDDHNKFEATPPLRRSSRQTQLLARYRDTAFITSMLSVVEPYSYKEASQFSEWRAAMEEEYESILKQSKPGI